MGTGNEQKGNGRREATGKWGMSKRGMEDGEATGKREKGKEEWGMSTRGMGNRDGE